MLEWWHLLSLDAATVAGLWAYAFGRAMGLHLPVMAPLLLATGTWMIYVGDRILDGLHPQTTGGMRKRHYFYAEHRGAFLLCGLVVGTCLAWLILTRMQPLVRREDTILFVGAAVYFYIIHSRGRRVERWLPKELVVGVLFAAATAVPTWARVPGRHLRLLPAVVLFAGLCWLNCVAIEWWEHQGTPRRSEAASQEAHVSTRWAARYLRRAAAGFAGASLVLAAVAYHGPEPEVAWLEIALLVSSLLYILLDVFRRRLTSLELRIAADAALLTPLLFLPWMH